jgi:hypothetical protein
VVKRDRAVVDEVHGGGEVPGRLHTGAASGRGFELPVSAESPGRASGVSDGGRSDIRNA